MISPSASDERCRSWSLPVSATFQKAVCKRVTFSVVLSGSGHVLAGCGELRRQPRLLPHGLQIDDVLRRRSPGGHLEEADRVGIIDRFIGYSHRNGQRHRGRRSGIRIGDLHRRQTPHRHDHGGGGRNLRGRNEGGGQRGARQINDGARGEAGSGNRDGGIAGIQRVGSHRRDHRHRVLQIDGDAGLCGWSLPG